MITRRSVIDQHQGTHPGTGLRITRLVDVETEYELDESDPDEQAWVDEVHSAHVALELLDAPARERAKKWIDEHGSDLDDDGTTYRRAIAAAGADIVREGQEDTACSKETRLARSPGRRHPMTAFALCRLAVHEAQRLALAPANAGGWIAVHPACREAVESATGGPLGDGADCLALLPADWREAALHPVTRDQAERIAAELERVAGWSGASHRDDSTPPAEIARRVRVWRGESYEFPERIELDDASLAEFERAVADPPAPNEALREMFRRARDRSKP